MFDKETHKEQAKFPLGWVKLEKKEKVI
jgi:hypothetical protein